MRPQCPSFQDDFNQLVQSGITVRAPDGHHLAVSEAAESDLVTATAAFSFYVQSEALLEERLVAAVQEQLAETWTTRQSGESN